MMQVAELWRYPVKSMAGEPLQLAELKPDGILGDRVVQVRDGRGRVLTARTKWRLLGLQATLGADGEPLVNGRRWTDPAVAEAVRAAAGNDARLVRDDSTTRFDVHPLLVATDGAVELLGVDRRRLRPNILIAGVPVLAEREWPGRRLRIGETVISIEKVRGRCVMTTFDPDSLDQDLSVLHRIVKEFGGQMALDCQVVRTGRLELGDPVELL